MHSQYVLLLSLGEKTLEKDKLKAAELPCMIQHGEYIMALKRVLTRPGSLASMPSLSSLHLLPISLFFLI
jgi:hypothetical protein